MAVSIDNYLKTLASDYYLKNDSAEVEKINNSIENLFTNLNKELGTLIKRYFVFGSYDRDTILPRSIDSKSDVDVMVIFKHTDYERTPETYRNWLKNFADKYYKDRYGSEVVRSFPTVTIKLNSINYDLVPAKETDYLYVQNDISIPDSGHGWRTTDPSDVKKKLVEANTKYKNVVRPIIRLLKAWNCTNGYPFESYDLEMDIISMNFFNDNVQSGLYWAAEHFAIVYSQTQRDKVASLNYNLGKAKECLDADDLTRAKQWLHRVFPDV